MRQKMRNFQAWVLAFIFNAVIQLLLLDESKVATIIRVALVTAHAQFYVFLQNFYP